MTIRSVILGLSPYLYWPLDDATGPAASDASGNSRPGAYGGNYSLLKPGPESGTFSAQFGPAFAQKAAPSYIASGQTATLMCWAAHAAVDPGLHTILQNLSASTGGGFDEQQGTGGIFQGVIGRNGIGTTGLSFVLLDNNWHHYAIVFTNTGVTAYVDGVNVGSSAAANAFTSATAMAVSGGYGYFAHFAAWNTALSQANIQSVYNAPAAIVQPGFTSLGQANQQANSDLASVLTKLDQIIAAVIRTYTS